MIIEIHDNRIIGEIISEFTAVYPFLKLEFYDESHQWQEASSHRYLLPHDKKIGEVRKKHNPGAMEIHAWQKTGGIEQEFRRLFGLNVQVLRHQGDIWIQTAGTDELTLEEQNVIGRNATQDLLHGTDRKFEQEKLF
jgi:hypothetical protein